MEVSQATGDIEDLHMGCYQHTPERAYIDKLTNFGMCAVAFEVFKKCNASFASCQSDTKHQVFSCPERCSQRP